MGKKRSSASSGSSSKSLQKPMADIDVDSDNEAGDLGDFVNLNGNTAESSDESDKEEVVFDLGANDDDDSSDEDDDDNDNDEDDSDEKSDGPEDEDEDDDAEQWTDKYEEMKNKSKSKKSKRQNESEASDESEGSSDSNSDSNSDSDSDEEDDEDELAKFVDTLDPSMRAAVLNEGGDSSSDGSDSEDKDGEDLGWGKKKDFYNADTADLEIGQDFADAEDEEEAVKEAERVRSSKFSASDFGGNSSESDSDAEDRSSKSKTSRSRGSANKNDMGLVGLMLDQPDKSESQIEKLNRDVSQLSRKERLKIIKRESPELISIINELKDMMSELQRKINPVRTLIQEVMSVDRDNRPSDELLEYLEVKQQIMLSYCSNVVFYLLLKSEGQSVKTHPVLRQLVELRYLMEKMRPLDSKLKHQIDRLMKAASLKPEERGNLVLRPQPSAMLTDDDDDSEEDDDDEDGSMEQDEDEDEDEDESDNSDEDNKKKYRVPKIAAVPYDDEEKKQEKEAARLERKRAKLRNSEVMAALREEFGSGPEAVSSSGVTGSTEELRQAQEADKERRDYEEERFMRMVVSKKDKKALKRAQKNAGKLDGLAGIGDVGEFEELAQLSGSQLNVKKDRNNGPGIGDFDMDMEGDMGGNYDDDDDDYGIDAGFDKKSMAALSKSLGALSGRGSDSGRIRRKAPSADSDALDDDMDLEGAADLYDAFTSKKRKYLDKKKEHYAVAPRYGSDMPEDLEDGERRAASYEIIKNRGLVAHKKKSNRNPRVKKKEQYAKAMVRRKGQVRDIISGVGNDYGGEATGIKSNLSRSRKMKN